LKLGAFTFVLHSHLPYARKAGRWPHGEEWIHEAITDSYLPLLNALHDLAGEGVRYRLTVGVTPVLAEQLADPTIVRNFEEYAEDLCARAKSDVARFERAGEAARAAIAAFYLERYAAVLAAFRDRFGRDLVGAFRSLEESGHAELATSAATHGYLPLLSRDSSIFAQVRTAIRAHQRHFGRRPEVFWLPECAYRPGLEAFLAAEGLEVFVVETHMIARARPEGTPRTTFMPYWVADQRVAAIARSAATSEQVWAAQRGYPGDPAYREFHSRDSESGLRYWRVTGDDVGLDAKAFYDPAVAFERAQIHAQHFARIVDEEVRKGRAETGTHGIVCAAYDTELFGHWWFEGAAWLKDVLRMLAASDTVALRGAAEFVREHPPRDSVALPDGSWGREGTHATWRNPETEWVWPLIDAAQRRIESIVERNIDASGPTALALAQLCRELLLLEASDWPFLVATGQARDYAEMRFSQHLERFDDLAKQIESAAVDAAAVERLWQLDRVFPDIDPQDFRAREGVAPPGAPGTLT